MVALHVICSLGHVATCDELFSRGVSAGRIRAEIASGVIKRAARGIYICRHSDADQRVAASSRAQIDCVSAVRRARVWSGLGFDLHLRRLPHAHPGGAHRASRELAAENALHTNASQVADASGRPVRVHWTKLRFSDAGQSWLVSPMNAVWQAIHCLDEENAIACLESAVHMEYLTIDQVQEIGRAAPARLQSGIREMEFTSDSGLETVVRRRLRHAGFSVVAQVHVNGLGDEDLVVDDFVALETDGEKWHGADRFQADRDRDLLAEGLGRRTLRLTHKHVMFEWETTLATIERVVADAKRARWQPARLGGRSSARISEITTGFDS
ncbi:hypothetical protein [Cryobacterium sp. PH31-O1]|uniref:hypothetical protein n=1 Tax=Cryobacterium sp. PH31-O1 TaxID=3046306 RepID=UPI0024B984F6|nr:hypothetical protein [Cryobacterium sp. PH31-O1]MDJ0337326.1 hypothetical protein [Cryobacterium sp. PH31-O1]